MTLAAAILFFGVFSFTSVDPGLVAQSAPQSNSAASAPAAQQQAPSTQAPESTKPSSAQPTTQTPVNKPKESTAKKTRHEKNGAPAAAGDSAPANGSSSASGPAPGSQQKGGAQGSAPSTSETPKNGAPSKTVVRQGGTAEPSIQLAGGPPSGEATQKRQSTAQMLKETEDNLKKVAYIQLSAAQQNSVSQIREFERQSNVALKAADYERAHTLAWKAKVLSDDLVTPKE